ncbi:MAG: SpoIIE family protein phosphatase [Clostridia bacterium]|nr:SpoIIE family protein phosphatase [Clostridia bacterium]
MDSIFAKLIGTLAVILVVAAFIGGSNIISRLTTKEKKWLYGGIAGILGGIFGIYGNISGFNLDGAVISVRDMGPMLSGFIGGPVGGLIAGLIAGLHRLTMGGITAHACVVATCCIGLFCGLISMKWHEYMKKTYVALLLSAIMETFHLGVVMIMVRPLDTAFSIVKQIAIPFIVTNSIGFGLMVAIIVYTEKQRSLMLEKSRMQSELEVANVIQKSLLPIINGDYPGRSEIDVDASMEAAKEVGGDFYDVFFVDGSRIAFVIGDVSGKGVPAALFMATAKITLQNCIRDIPKLSEAIGIANNALCARNEADMFVTLWVGILDMKSGEVHYVSAGHNPPVVIRNGKAEYLKIKNGFVLAGMEDMFYKEYIMKLEKGDTVYLYTDGVTEANSSDQQLFGEERLLRCFENADKMTARQILESVKQSVDGFVRDNDQFDDMTMLCFRYIGTDGNDVSEG